MKIGIEAQRLFRTTKHGMDVVVLEIIKNLQQLDTENEYIIYVKDDVDSACIEETNNFKIKVLPKSNYAIWEQVLLPKQVTKDKIDILHCTSNTGPIFVNCKLVLTLHDIIYLENLSFKGSNYQNIGNLYRKLIVPRVIEKCDQVITVSNFERDNIVNFFKDMDFKIDVVYNGVSDDFCPNYDILKPNFDFLENFKNGYMLFLGNTAPKKNTEGVLKAYRDLVKEHMNLPHLLITDVDRSYIKKVLSEIGAENLIDKIHICDYIPYTSMNLLYSKAKLFLYPSLRESFGMPILEAMACGTPVITSNTSSMPEISGGCALLVNPLVHHEIAGAVITTLENTNGEISENIERGFAQVRQFNWRNSARELLNLYNEVYINN